MEESNNNYERASKGCIASFFFTGCAIVGMGAHSSDPSMYLLGGLLMTPGIP